MADISGKPPKRPWIPLAALLGVDLLCAIGVAKKIPFQAPNLEYLCDARVFTEYHRIASDFLPIGYGVLLGIGNVLGHQTGMTAVTILLSLCLVALIWWYLQSMGVSTRASLVIAGLFSIYPDFLLNYNKGMDTVPTALILFAFVPLLVAAVGRRSFSKVDLLLALTVGYALLVRPNMVLFLPITWLVFWRFRTERWVSRSAIQAAIAVSVYLLVTTAVHGRPFFPQNGPYNFYSGANQYTEKYVVNEEDSLLYALRDHGIEAAAPTGACPSEIDEPGLPGLRSPRLKPLYSKFAVEFIEQHPGTMVRLVWVKFKNMMYPDLRLYRLKSVGGMLKVLAALAFPLWLIAFLFLPHPGGPAAKLVLGATVAVYLMPFVLIISSPRFRTPLDYLFWIDLGGILALWWTTRRSTME